MTDPRITTPGEAHSEHCPEPGPPDEAGVDVQIASILAAGYLRLLLSGAPDPPTPQHVATCVPAESAERAHNRLDVPARTRVHCGDGRHYRKRANRRPDHASGRDPGVVDGPAPGGVPAPLGAPDGLVESPVVATEGQLASPGEPASGPRHHRPSDARSGDSGPAPKPAPGCADPGRARTRCPGSAASTTRHGDRAGVPGPSTDDPGARGRV